MRDGQFAERTGALLLHQVGVAALAGIVLFRTAHQFAGRVVDVIQRVVDGIHHINRRIGFVEDVVLQSVPVIGRHQQFAVHHHVLDFQEDEFRLAGQNDDVVGTQGQGGHFVLDLLGLDDDDRQVLEAGIGTDGLQDFEAPDAGAPKRDDHDVEPRFPVQDIQPLQVVFGSHHLKVFFQRGCQHLPGDFRCINQQQLFHGGTPFQTQFTRFNDTMKTAVLEQLEQVYTDTSFSHSPIFPAPLRPFFRHRPLSPPGCRFRTGRASARPSGSAKRHRAASGRLPR